MGCRRARREVTGLRSVGRTRPFDRRSLLAPAPGAARSLLGALVTSDLGGEEVTVRIVETEAYRQDDPASHSARGRTPTTSPMFGAPGHAYVYFTYGMHHCLNVSCEPEDVGAAVLLRAGIVVHGSASARTRRPASSDRNLARGPARLTQALGLDRSQSGQDLLAPGGHLRLLTDGWTPDPEAVRVGPRVGVRGAPDVPWRWWLDDVAEVSAYRRHPKAAR